MGRKGIEEAYGFSLDVINEIRRAIDESGLSDSEIIKQSGISSAYFYRRMRGERPFNTNDIAKIADVLGMDAFIILRRAAAKNEQRRLKIDPSMMSEEERLNRTLGKLNRNSTQLAALHDENKLKEREYDADQGA